MRSFEQQAFDQEAPGADGAASASGGIMGRMTPKMWGIVIAVSVVVVGGIIVVIVLATRPATTTMATTDISSTTALSEATTTDSPSGGGGTDSPTSVASSTAAPSMEGSTTAATNPSTGPLPPRSAAMTSEQAAKYLNDLYNGWQAKQDDATPVGVTVTMLGQPTGFFKNIFCSKVYNPDVKGYTGCYQGHADCRLSASVVSSGWMRDTSTNKIASFGGRAVGYIFNQTQTQQKWTRCSSIWDGASFRLYNRGCGDGAADETCDAGKDSAFNNICPKNSGESGHTCTKDDDEVSRKVCAGTFPDATAPVPKAHATSPSCFFPGPAFDWRGQSDFQPGADYTHVMARERLRLNGGEDNHDGKFDVLNNEVIIDAELFLEDLQNDPVSAVPAIVYTKSTNANNINRNYAIQVRDDLCSNYKCEENGGGLIPLVMIDDTDSTSNPFVADTEPVTA